MDIISFGDGICFRMLFSSSVIQGRIKCSRWSGKLMSSSLNRLTK